MDISGTYASYGSFAKDSTTWRTPPTTLETLVILSAIPLVILSGVSVSRSEADTESKDPYTSSLCRVPKSLP
ncbi:MAG: hypothetical protein WB421_20370 [Terriglobales bacterium]